MNYCRLLTARPIQKCLLNPRISRYFPIHFFLILKIEGKKVKYRSKNDHVSSKNEFSDCYGKMKTFSLGLNWTLASTYARFFVRLRNYEVIPHFYFHFSAVPKWFWFSITIPSGLLQLQQKNHHNYGTKWNPSSTSRDPRNHQRWFTRNQKYSNWFFPRKCRCKFIDFHLTKFDNQSYSIRK